MNKLLYRYEGLLDEMGFVLVDTSAIPTFLHRSFDRKGERARLRVLDNEIELTSAFPGIIPSHVTFPSEVIGEYVARTDGLAAGSRWCYNNGMKTVANRIADLRTAREFAVELFREHNHTDYFLSFKGRQVLPYIYAASMDVASGVASLLREEGNTVTEPPSGVDLAVYAYARGIALDRHDACILAVDRGFRFLNDRFSKNRDRLEDEYGLPSAYHDTDVVTLDKWTGRSDLSTSCGHFMPL
jgi:hypothetical protein